MAAIAPPRDSSPAFITEEREEKLRAPPGEKLKEGEGGDPDWYRGDISRDWARIVCVEATIGERGGTLINEAVNNGNVSTENSAGRTCIQSGGERQPEGRSATGER